MSIAIDGVVLGTVDPETGGQALQGGGQRRLRGVQVTLCIERGNVCVDYLGHF